LLKQRKLLILLVAHYAKNARSASNGYVPATRQRAQLMKPKSRISAALQAPDKPNGTTEHVGSTAAEALGETRQIVRRAVNFLNGFL